MFLFSSQKLHSCIGFHYKSKWKFLDEFVSIHYSHVIDIAEIYLSIYLFLDYTNFFFNFLPEKKKRSR